MVFESDRAWLLSQGQVKLVGGVLDFRNFETDLKKIF